MRPEQARGRTRRQRARMCGGSDTCSTRCSPARRHSPARGSRIVLANVITGRARLVRVAGRHAPAPCGSACVDACRRKKDSASITWATSAWRWRAPSRGRASRRRSRSAQPITEPAWCTSRGPPQRFWGIARDRRWAAVWNRGPAELKQDRRAVHETPPVLVQSPGSAAAAPPRPATIQEAIDLVAPRRDGHDPSRHVRRIAHHHRRLSRSRRQGEKSGIVVIAPPTRNARECRRDCDHRTCGASSG